MTHGNAHICSVLAIAKKEFMKSSSEKESQNAVEVGTSIGKSSDLMQSKVGTVEKLQFKIL